MTTRLKYLCYEVDRRVGANNSELLSVSIHRGVVPRAELTEDLPRAEDLSNYKLCEPGDIIVNRMRAFQGATGVSPRQGAVSPDYLVLRPRVGMVAGFMHYAFKSDWFIGQMTSRIRGIGSADLGSVRTPRINAEDLLGLEMKSPPTERQQQVADFLDDQVARIDRIIAARKLQAADLLALFDRLFDQEWDRLSRSYGSARTAYLLRGMEQGWSPDAEAGEAAEHEWAVMRAGCVNGGVFNLRDHKVLPKELPPRRQYEIRSGDLLMSRASGSMEHIGSVAMVPGDVRHRLLLSDKVYRLFSDTSKATSSYLAMMLRSPAARRHIKAGISGAEGMANNLPASVVRSIPVPAVPLVDQQPIVDQYLVDESATRRQVAGLDKSSELLAELKKSLITAAVTGEFDVSLADGSQVPV